MGALPGLADLYVAVTHSGVTLAPVVGRLTAEEVLNSSRTRDVRALSPGTLPRLMIMAGTARYVWCDVEVPPIYRNTLNSIKKIYGLIEIC